MINLLFTVVFTEMTLIATLLFETPLRKLVVMGIDLLKRGKGPLVAKTVAATVLVVFTAILYTVMAVYRRSREAGITSPTEVILAEQLLEASLMGFSLFLAMMIDRLHYYIKELHNVREKSEHFMKRSNDQENVDNQIVSTDQYSKPIKKNISIYERKSN